MADCSRRALVVDDEPTVRSLTIRALRREGFSCDAAADGVEAKQMMDSNHYAVVVTDLRMPNRHGYALAMDILALENRPAIVVLTGIFDARLVKDLIGWGVDCLEIKPVQYDFFATKVRAIVDRRSGVLPKYVAELISWRMEC